MAKMTWKGSRRSGAAAFRRSGVATALDIEGNSLRVVQTARKSGTAEVLRAATVVMGTEAEVAGWSAEEKGVRIAKALGELRLKSGPVVMGVPRAMAVLRPLLLPAAEDPGELASMVQFQISRELPFPIEEAVVDFHVGASGARSENGAAKPAEPAQKLEVLVAVVRKEVIEEYSRITAAAGLKLQALGLRSYANARCIEEWGGAEPGETIGLISLRADEVVIDILSGQTLGFSRMGSVKGHSSEEDSNDEGLELEERVVIEVVRSLHSYQSMQPERPVAKLLVAGSTGREASLVERLSARLQLACEHFDPSPGMEQEEGVNLAGALAAFGLALGALDASGLPFDFLNPKRPPVKRNTRRTRWLAAAAGTALLLGSAAVVRAHLIRDRLQQKSAVEEQLAAAEKHRPAYRQGRLHAKTVQDWTREATEWLDHTLYLSAVLPGAGEVYLTSISTSSRGQIRMSVQARTVEVLSELDRLLRAAGYDVTPFAVNPTRDKHGYAFQTTVEVQIPPRLILNRQVLTNATQTARTGREDETAQAGAAPAAAPAKPAAAPVADLNPAKPVSKEIKAEPAGARRQARPRARE